MRPHLGKARQRQQLPVGLQPGRQSAHGGRGSKNEEGAPAGSSEGTGEDEAGGRGGGDSSKARGERRAAKYKGVTWDRVKKMWRCVQRIILSGSFASDLWLSGADLRTLLSRVRLCLVGGSRQHVGYFADEDEVSSTFSHGCLYQRPLIVVVRVQGASAYLTALQAAKAQGLHVRCEG